MKYRTKARVAIVAAIVAFLALVTFASAAERPAPLDPNEIPFAIEPNAYTADLLDYVVAEPNVSVVSSVSIHNKGGWLCDLTIVMADGTPADTVIQRLAERPVKDPNGGWNQGFQWAWTPPAEGVYYLELRASTRDKATWKVDRRTVVVYAFGEDLPFLWVRDLPELRLTQAEKIWQYATKLQRPLTSPTRVWR